MALKYFSDLTGGFYDTEEEFNKAEEAFKFEETRKAEQKKKEEAEYKAKLKALDDEYNDAYAKYQKSLEDIRVFREQGEAKLKDLIGKRDSCREVLDEIRDREQTVITKNKSAFDRLKCLDDVMDLFSFLGW